MLKVLGSSFATIILATSSMAETSIDSAVGATWQPYDGARIAFDVLRKGKPFGTHIVSFDKTNDGELKVTTDVDLKVKVGPFTAFRYQLDSVERWQDGQLVALNGRTNDDGDKTTVQAALDDAALRVEGSAFKGSVAPNIVPSSHWNMDQVRSTQMLSTEDGSVLSMDIIPKGRETLTIDGQDIAANRFLLDSDIDIDLWYDDQGRWLKLTFEARNQTIEYRLSELY